MTAKTDREYETEYAVRNAKEALVALRKHFESMAQEIARYEERFATAETVSKQASWLSSAIHNASCNNNPRLDLLAGAMGEILRVDAKYRA